MLYEKVLDVRKKQNDGLLRQCTNKTRWSSHNKELNMFMKHKTRLRIYVVIGWVYLVMLMCNV